MAWNGIVHNDPAADERGDAMGIVVVGAGLAGLKAAESLRVAGFGGALCVIGDELLLPYDRPSLSKQVLSEGGEAPELRRKAGIHDITWRTDSHVSACDLAARRVRLVDGTEIPFDGLVAATGIRPRRQSIPSTTAARHVLRTATDARALRRVLSPGTDVVVVGAGFVGCEVAASARGLGANVTVVALDDEPMLRPLGRELGGALRRRHEAHGVRFHLGRTVVATADAGSGAETVTLNDGTELRATVLVEAIGSTPNTDWLAGNGLDLSDGVLVDDSMQAGTALVPVVAAGDLARHPNARFGGVPRRVEHWGMATETGRRAGRTLADLVAGREPDRSPFAALPSFWSDQYEHQVQSLGMPELAERIEVVSGDLDGPCVVEYHAQAGLVGVVGVDRTDDVAAYRGRIGVPR